MQALQACVGRDALGIADAKGIVHGCETFELKTADASAVFAARIERSSLGSVLWIDGAAGHSEGSLLHVGLELAAEMARQAGCERVGFETTRPGLVREAQKHGYQVAGFIMTKAV